MNFDLIIIGSGPGGYVAAIRASQLGMKVAVAEKSEIGGICLNWGCIPTKALLKSSQVYSYAKSAKRYGVEIENVTPNFTKIVARSRTIASQMSKGVEFLFKKNDITLLKGFGKIIEKGKVEITNGEKTEQFTAKNIIIATGSRSRQLPNLQQDGDKIIGYREALSLKEQPESMLVVGSGAIGTELAFFYSTLGTKVHLVEYMPRITSLEDEEISAQLEKSLKKAKIKILTSSEVLSVHTDGEKCKVTIKTPKGEQVLEADKVLSAVGISPNLENIGIEELGIETEHNRIKVDDFYQTNIEGIFAIGDVIATPALAHVASAEGITCVEKIAGQNPEKIDYQNIPGAIYTDPEVASVGYNEKTAQEAGFDVRIGRFPFSALGKATAAGSRDGFAKLIFDAKTDKLIGASLIGMNVTEMLAELVVSKQLGATGKQLLKSIHPHPTMSEAIMEAAAQAHGEAIHF